MSPMTDVTRILSAIEQGDPGAQRPGGNVRELENVLERAVILATGSTLEVATDLLPAPAKTRPVEERAQPGAKLALMACHRGRWRLRGPVRPCTCEFFAIPRTPRTFPVSVRTIRPDL